MFLKNYEIYENDKNIKEQKNIWSKYHSYVFNFWLGYNFGSDIQWKILWMITINEVTKKNNNK